MENLSHPSQAFSKPLASYSATTDLAIRAGEVQKDTCLPLKIFDFPVRKNRPNILCFSGGSSLNLMILQSGPLFFAWLCWPPFWEAPPPKKKRHARHAQIYLLTAVSLSLRVQEYLFFESPLSFAMVLCIFTISTRRRILNSTEAILDGTSDTHLGVPPKPRPQSPKAPDCAAFFARDTVIRLPALSRT